MKRNPACNSSRLSAFPPSCLLALLLLACLQDRASPGDLRGTLLPDPWAKPDFVLTDTRGEPFDFRSETDGYVTLLFFGYTYCPDICPVHMANLGAVRRRLPPEVSNRIKVVFVSTDPERDTADRIRGWLDTFDRSFIGLRGALDTVNAIQRELKLPDAIRLEGDGADYTVGHAAQVIAFTADNVARVVYPFGIRQADWAHDLPRLVEGRW